MSESREESGGELTDEEARAIARRMVFEANESPEDHDHMNLDAPRNASKADETRIERALVELGAVEPENIPPPDEPLGALGG
jgi:hypothetical protein